MSGRIGIMPATYASASLNVVYTNSGIGIASGVHPKSLVDRRGEVVKTIHSTSFGLQHRMTAGVRLSCHRVAGVALARAQSCWATDF
jgi:hypothetical protein